MDLKKELESELSLKLIEKLEEAFEKYNPTNKQKKEIIKKVKKEYKNSSYEPAEGIGVIAAQSISEPATQLTMRTYHVAGGARIQVTLGLPRLIEVVDARRNPSTPAMTVYLEDEFNNKEGARKIAFNIKETKLKNIAEEDVIDLVNSQIEIKIAKERLKDLEVDEEELLKKVKKRNYEVKFENGTLFFNPKKDVSLRDLQKAKNKIMDKHLKGIKDVSQAVTRKVKAEDEWRIETLGSNLKKVLKIEGVDTTRTKSNDPREMEKVLGIEACRNSIIEEVSNTLESQGMDVDIRHIMLVGDVMTVDGELKAIGRYGVSGEKGSVLARANFEMTVRHLTNAAINGETDNLESTVENVLINQVVPVGTGLCDLKFKKPESK